MSASVQLPLEFPIYNQIGTPIWRSRVDGRCDFFNDAWLEFTGRTLDQELGEGWLDGIHADDRAACVETYRAAFAARKPCEIEFRMLHADGSYRWVLSAGRPFVDQAGRFRGYIGTCFDISKRKQSEQALSDSERRFRGIFDSMFQFIGLLAPDGTLLEANQTALGFADLSHDEVVGKPLPDLPWWSYSPEVQAQLWAAIRRAAQGELVRYEVDVRGAGATMRTIDFSLKPVRDESGQVVLLIPEGRDITERRHVENAWRNVVEGTSGATGMALFESVVRHLCMALGTRFAFIGEVVGSEDERVRTLAAWADGELTENFEYSLEGTPCKDVVGARVCIYASGVQRHFPNDRMLVEMGVESYAATPLLDQARRPVGLLAVLDDGPLEDTDFIRSLLTVFGARAAGEILRQRAEEKMQQHQAELARVLRISTLSETASNIAHEVNQPLAAIANYARGAIRRLESRNARSEELGDVLRQIARQAERAGDIIHHLRALVRKQVPRFAAVNLNEMVPEAFELVAGEFRRGGIRVKLELDTKPTWVRGDRVQLEQVVINLLVNALESMSQHDGAGATLTLRTCHGPDGNTQIDVIDSGPGLQQDMLERVFQPFFTTKPGGMGMGLTISRSIIESHGGRLWATTVSGQGALFRLSLPPAEP